MLFAPVAAVADARITDLRCEYVANALGVDVLTPRLSWRIDSDVPGYKQAAYQILVAGSASQLAAGTGELWDSGKVESGQSQLIPYAGKPLRSKMQCHWKVRV